MTKQPFRFTLLFLLICLTLPLSTTAQVVDIPDANLRAAIEAQLGKASGATITVADMANLTRLEAKNANISDLAGLEHATNLTELYLGAEWVAVERNWINSNSVSNLSPLAGLTNLMWLSLEANSISDISPLAGLTNLTVVVNFLANSISDVSPLAGLTNLTVVAAFWQLHLRHLVFSRINQPDTTESCAEQHFRHLSFSWINQLGNARACVQQHFRHLSFSRINQPNTTRAEAQLHLRHFGFSTFNKFGTSGS